RPDAVALDAIARGRRTVIDGDAPTRVPRNEVARAWNGAADEVVERVRNLNAEVVRQGSRAGQVGADVVSLDGVASGGVGDQDSGTTNRARRYDVAGCGRRPADEVTGRALEPDAG